MERTSPLDRAADELLAANPSKECPVYSERQLRRLHDQEVPVAPEYIDVAKLIFKHEDAANVNRIKDRERKQRAAQLTRTLRAV
jgi:hypothetical protein